MRALLLVLLASPAMAVDLTLVHMGRLLDGDDSPVTSPGLSVTFSIFESDVPLTVESPLWTETYTVPVYQGVFSVTLGSQAEGKKALPGSVFAGGASRYLEVAIDAGALTPRLAIGSAPSAVVALDVECTACISASELDASVDITLDDGEVTTAKLADGAATEAKIADGAVGDSKIVGMSASKLLGLVEDSQVAAVAASKVTGTLATEQLADQAVTDAKIVSVSAGKITGLVVDGQLEFVAAAKVTGALSDDQLGGMSASKLIGPVTSDQIAGLATSKLSGPVTAISGHGLGALATLSAVSGTTITDASISNDDLASGAFPGISGVGELGVLTVLGETRLAAGSGNVGIGAGTPRASLDLGSRPDGLILPSGATSDRPSSPVKGTLRFNTTTNRPEYFNGTAWRGLAPSIVATGGNVTEIGGYRIHTFLASGILSVMESVTADVLVVAGGGGGGMDMGGGGGGGGVIATTIDLTPQSYTVTVGAGGAGAPAANTGGQPGGHQYTIPARQGGNSVFGSLTAIGGGFGGSSYNAYSPGAAGGAGGSGGGASGYSDGGTRNGGAGTSGQGFRGGNQSGQYYSGGGGGAGGAGADGSNQANGGPGLLSAINGTSLYWGGGGGGAGYSRCGGNGGVGGGGGGSACTTTGGAGLNNGSPGGGGSINTHTNTPGGNGGANTGGGGGGGGHYHANNKGGDGGSGIVIVRYPLQ